MDLHDSKRIILKKKGIREIDLQTDQLQKAIGSGAITLAKTLVEKARVKAINQLDIVLDCAMHEELLSAKELADENIAEFEAQDMYADFCCRAHPRYGDFKDVLARCFVVRITATRELLSGKGEDYDALVRSRFANKKEALSFLRKELLESARALHLVEENPKLLKLPFGIGTHKAIESMEVYLGYRLQYLSEELDRIYST